MRKGFTSAFDKATLTLSRYFETSNNVSNMFRIFLLTIVCMALICARPHHADAQTVSNGGNASDVSDTEIEAEFCLGVYDQRLQTATVNCEQWKADLNKIKNDAGNVDVPKAKIDEERKIKSSLETAIPTCNNYITSLGNSKSRLDAYLDAKGVWFDRDKSLGILGAIEEGKRQEVACATDRTPSACSVQCLKTTKAGTQEGRKCFEGCDPQSCVPLRKCNDLEFLPM